MARAFEQNNAASLGELRALVATLRDADGAVVVGDGWSVSTSLGHLSFWDRFMAARWRRAAADQLTLPEDLPDLADQLNDSLAPSWAAVPVADAVRLALEAAEEIDGVVAALSDGAAASALALGRARWVDRSIHRRDHVAAIRAALGR